MHTSNARRNNSECTPGTGHTGRRGLHCLAQRALDLPQRHRAPASFLSLEFSPCTPIVLVVIVRKKKKKKKKKERKRREEASTIYFTITASSDIRYCRHNTATPIDLDRVPVSFREVVHTHTRMSCTQSPCVHVWQGSSNHPRPPVLTRPVATTSYEVERPFEICRWPKEASRTAWLTSNPRFLSLNRKLRERHRLSNDRTTHGRPRPVFNR